MRASRIVTALFIAGFVLGGCSGITDGLSPGETPERGVSILPVRTISLNGPGGQRLSLDVEVASTQEQQARGLMFRTKVERGMLFVFTDERPLSFWMKNTLVPLDIIYFAADGSFVSTTTMEPCTADPCRSYPSSGPARYALEMPAGFMSGSNAIIGEEWKLEMDN